MTFDEKAARRKAVGVPAALAAGVLVLGQIWPAAPEASAAPQGAVPISKPAPAARNVAAMQAVTLITGDRVRVSGPDATRAAIEPGPGRERVSFATGSAGGHLIVMPLDAARLVQTNKVDRRLFDITELLRAGYGDADKPDVPLIVSWKPGAKRAKVASTRELPAVNGAAVSVLKERTQGIWKSLTADAGVRKIWLDGRRRPSLDVSVPQIGGPAAWQAGFTGKGMTVAVLDTGVDATHPDLAGSVAQTNFVDGDENPDGDDVGHGTHVASTIIGDGKASGGKYRGVAPEAELLSGKVCGTQYCDDSAILAAMQWAAVDKKAKVISMSLGALDSPEIDPLEQAVNTLSAQSGALFVIAAGNSGQAGAGSTESPGSADAALSVGAVDPQDEIAYFSSRGPRLGDGAIKPDITAPGVGIVAAKATGTGDGEPGPEIPAQYTRFSGTSMATPHVAGSALLLAQAHPDWKGPQLKATLMAAAKPNAEAGAFEQGAGRVDVGRAVTQTLSADPPSVSYGQLKWPHTGDAKIEKKLTYRNSSDEAVVLHLAVAAPFSVSAPELSVPAGGSAEVTVTADVPAAAENKSYTARLTATGPAGVLETPLAVDKETEKYDVKLRHIGADGQPTNNFFTYIAGTTGDYFDLPWDESGTVTLRLPKGRYTTGSVIGKDVGTASLFRPLLDVSSDVAVDFDARLGKPVAQEVPAADAVTQTVSAQVTATVDGGLTGIGNSQDSFDGLTVTQVGPPTPDLPITGDVTSAWVKSGSGEDGIDSPWAYLVADQMPAAELYAGYQHRFTTAELATETQVIRSMGTGNLVRQNIDAVDPSGREIGFGQPKLRAPSTDRTNYYSVLDGLGWRVETEIGGAGEIGWGGVSLDRSPRIYRAGERTSQEWGAAPYGTAFSTYYDWAGRQRDQLYVTVPPFGDGAGNAGRSWSFPMRTKLFRGDQLLDDNDGFGVGVDGLSLEPAEYRVEQTTEAGDGLGGLATRTETVLTFTSAGTADGSATDVPVSTVHFAPRLDLANAAPSGRPFRIPVELRDRTGKAIQAKELAVEVSFDDGKTWTTAPVIGGAALVAHPKGPGFVSLRAHATNTAGGTTKQTIIRAYRLA